MHNHPVDHLTHDHAFAQDERKHGETRTWIVIALTAVTMVVEIAAGWIYGSMALLADGLHMASHAVALLVAAYAYLYARRRAYDARFSFGTGKVSALAGFTSAILLMLFALAMVWESGHRLVAPVAIAFDQAIVVAIIGLVVNGISAVILKPESHHHDSHHGHAHGHTHRHTQDRAHDHAHDHAHDDDHNLKAAYLHVIADALTSILAIAALISGKYLGWSWMDPVMGLVGAAVIIRWSWGLVGQTSGVLLDHQAPDQIIEAVRAAIENGSTDKVTDLHVWSIAPGKWAGAVAVISDDPQAPAHYKSLVASRVQVDHLTVEVHPCPDALSRNAAPGS